MIILNMGLFFFLLLKLINNFFYYHQNLPEQANEGLFYMKKLAIFYDYN